MQPSVIATLPRFWVLNKPPGWLSIPGRTSGKRQKVLSDWVRRELGPVWIVHRLDRETSGVILFARDEEAHREANKWFASQTVKKTYRFLAHGSPAFPTFNCAEPVEEKASRTLFERTEIFSAWNAFEGLARPKSGRRHQIRIHLEDLGHPILGDPEYGGAKQLLPLSAMTQSPDGSSNDMADEMTDPGIAPLLMPRVLLHAEQLVLPDGAALSAELPADFLAVREALRGSSK